MQAWTDPAKLGQMFDVVPFSEVVVPLPGASVLDQIAGWTGRNVLG